MDIFHTARLRIRRFSEEDKDDFFQLSGSEEVMRYIRPPSRKEDSDRFLSENISDYERHPGRGRWAVIGKETNKLIGSFAIIPIPNQPEKTQLGYSFIPSEWGKGYASELARAGLAWFFSIDPSPVIYGVTELPNVASQKVLLNAGFKPAGSYTEEGKELLLFAAERI